MWTHLCDEYTHRYGKVHEQIKNSEMLSSANANYVEPCVDPYLAMQMMLNKQMWQRHTRTNINYKKDFAKWTNRPVPQFMKFETHAGYAS